MTSVRFVGPLITCVHGKSWKRSEKAQIISRKSKELHVLYSKCLSSPEIDKCASTIWLKNENVFNETTGFVMAIQDRCIPTNNYWKYILKEDIADDGCRKCHHHSETIEHVTGSYPKLAGIKCLRIVMMLPKFYTYISHVQIFFFIT